MDLTPYLSIIHTFCKFQNVELFFIKLSVISGKQQKYLTKSLRKKLTYSNTEPFMIPNIFYIYK